MTDRALHADVLGRLVAILDRHQRLAIAVSGGVDSMTLAHVARRFSRASTTMFHATGPAVPAAAGERVRAHATAHGWPLVVLDAGEFADARYRANPIDRCFHCKSNLYAAIRRRSSDTIASGTNRDDLADFRPGLRAAEEAGVVHPYVEAGIDKAGVYALARVLGLGDLARLPAQPCLASRVETGIAIATDDLAFIDDVERKLAARLGREAVVRCRVTRAGVVIELGGTDEAAPGSRTEAVGQAASESLAKAVGETACRAHGRHFAGVRPYRRGAAFLSEPGEVCASAPRAQGAVAVTPVPITLVNAK